MVMAAIVSFLASVGVGIYCVSLVVVTEDADANADYPCFAFHDYWAAADEADNDDHCREELRSSIALVSANLWAAAAICMLSFVNSGKQHRCVLARELPQQHPDMEMGGHAGTPRAFAEIEQLVAAAVAAPSTVVEIAEACPVAAQPCATAASATTTVEPPPAVVADAVILVPETDVEMHAGPCYC